MAGQLSIKFTAGLPKTVLILHKRLVVTWEVLNLNKCNHVGIIFINIKKVVLSLFMTAISKVTTGKLCTFGSTPWYHKASC